MAKTLSVILGIVFVVLSLVAFIQNGFIGSTGFFMTGAAYNIVYLIFGVVLLIASGAGEAPSSLWLKIIGIIEVLLFIDGLFQPNALIGFISANGSDMWLNLVLGVILLIGGYSMKGTSMGTESNPTQQM